MANNNTGSLFTSEQLHKLYQYGLSIAQDRDTAYDLLQTALLAFLENSKLEINDPLRYVRTSMRNAAINMYRSDSKRQTRLLDDDDQIIDTDLRSLEQVIVDQDDLDHVWKNLSVLEREILFLWAVEGYTIDEISSHTGVARGTLLARLHRLRKRVQASASHHQNVYGGENA